MGDDRGFIIAKLNGENYLHWKFSMSMYLKGKDLWAIVKRTEVLGENATEKQRDSFRRRENTAISCICLGIVESLHICVHFCETAAEAWESLENHFEEKTLAWEIQFRRKLYNTNNHCRTLGGTWRSHSWHRFSHGPAQFSYWWVKQLDYDVGDTQGGAVDLVMRARSSPQQVYQEEGWEETWWPRSNDHPRRSCKKKQPQQPQQPPLSEQYTE